MDNNWSADRSRAIKCGNKQQNERNARIMDGFENHRDMSIGMVFVLADMARNGVIPNGSFGDDECNVWLEFRNMIQ